MKRVYLHGENTHKKPWKINVDDNDFEMEDLAEGFNEMSKYSKLQTRLLMLLKLIYIVSYFWASRYMKQLKLVQLKKLIHEHIV
jgi:small-conductance mechanosensitive channel